MASKGNKKQNIPPTDVSWLEELAAEINIPLAPLGWFTITEICEKTQRDHQVVRRILKERNAEVKKFKHIGLDGKVYVVKHYKL